MPHKKAELGPEVWNPTGIKVLGTPVGSAAFVQEKVEGGSGVVERHPFSPNGRFSCSALDRGATISCARCHHHSLKIMFEAMMTGWNV